MFTNSPQTPINLGNPGTRSRVLLCMCWLYPWCNTCIDVCVHRNHSPNHRPKNPDKANLTCLAVPLLLYFCVPTFIGESNSLWNPFPFHPLAFCFPGPTVCLATWWEGRSMGSSGKSEWLTCTVECVTCSSCVEVKQTYVHSSWSACLYNVTQTGLVCVCILGWGWGVGSMNALA